MSEDPQDPAVALARREEFMPLPPMNEQEVERSWRIARTLAASGMFKDARQAEQAFAKMVMGRDLGLSPTQAMVDLHIIEGKPVTGANTLAGFVRGRGGYDFRVGWLKVDVPAKAGEAPQVSAVWAEDEDPADLRDVYGCVIDFTVDGITRGMSRWTQADSVKSGLWDRGNKNHQKFSRAMWFARALSQGVRWFVPEVTRGVPVYVTGEIETMATPTGGLADEPLPSTGHLVPEVEAVLARAQALGHAGLMDRTAAYMATHRQIDEVVAAWVARATAALDAQEAAQEPEDAVVVDPEPEPAAGAEAPRDAPQAPRVDDLSLEDRAQWAMDAALAAEEEGHEDAEVLMVRALELAEEASAVAGDGEEVGGL